MNPHPELVIFDLIGTTVRDDGAIVAAFRFALSQFGLDARGDAIDSMRGASKREVIAKAILATTDRRTVSADDVMTVFREELRRRRHAVGVSPIDGAGDVFTTLRRNGMRVALTSGLDRETMTAIVEELQWTPLVDACICADDVAEGRPAPFLIFRAMEATRTRSTAAVANVGDTVFDLRSAANAGVGWSFGVLTGAHSREALAAEPHTAIAGSIRDVPALLADGR